jgi:phosphomethylpyrimidine synthase
LVKTQLEQAKAGVVTPEMQRVSERERVSVELVRAELAAGRLVIPANRLHLAGVGFADADASPTAAPDAAAAPDVQQAFGGVRLDPVGIGRAVTTKINANIGASPVSSCKEHELLKLQWAVKFGADAVMDLSTGGDLDQTRRFLIANSSVPIGTVPMYSMIVAKPVEELTYADMLGAIERQAAQGVDFFTIHAGILRRHLAPAMRRKLGIVSRGGSLLAKWMLHTGKENPMYEMFDEISSIMRRYDVAYSLGDGLRPGCLADASDEAQFGELDVLGELVHRARASGVQTMVEGPGHVPYDQIEMNMKRQQEVCDGAPFYVLGPIVTDMFPGYDHITSTIGATAAAFHGASFLCYVTPSEHLALPRPEDVKQGCIAYKIAAHAADVARHLPGARDRDDAISDARARFDWPAQFELAFDGDLARDIRSRDKVGEEDYCSMCGRSWCAVRLSNEIKAGVKAM